MRRFALVLAACSAPQPAQPVVHHTKASLLAEVPIIQGTHGSEIRELAMTDDGLAALSVDADGKLRLWPALDGSREPVAIAAPDAAQVALARDGEGFAIAVIDRAGTLAILRTSSHGVLRARDQVTLDIAVTSVTATAASFFALRADGVLDCYAPDASLAGRLAPRTGERIRGVLYRAGAALALIVTGELIDDAHGRWIELASGAHWGADVESLPVEPAHAALSPDHRSVAGTILGEHGFRERVFDLATGASRSLGGGTGRVIGFIEPDVVAVALETTIGFFDHKGEQIPRAEIAMPLENAAGQLAAAVNAPCAGDHRVAGAFGVELAVMRPGDIGYLGYREPEPTRITVAPTGVALGHPASHVLIDRDLHTRTLLELPAPVWARPTKWIDILPLDDRYTLALAESELGGHWIEVLAGTGGAGPPIAVTDLRIAYELATHLLATTAPDEIHLQRLDPASGTFGPAMVLSGCHGAIEVTLLDPALAHGAVASYRCELQLGEIRAEDLAPVIAPRPRRPLIGEYAAVDRTGHIYSDRDPLVAALDRDLDAAHAPSRTIRPSADGALVAGFTPSRLALANRWTIALDGITDVQWSHGELFVLAHGLARVDLADGHLVARQCGWRFGLWPGKDLAEHAATLCDL